MSPPSPHMPPSVPSPSTPRCVDDVEVLRAALSVASPSMIPFPRTCYGLIAWMAAFFGGGEAVCNLPAANMEEAAASQFGVFNAPSRNWHFYDMCPVDCAAYFQVGPCAASYPPSYPFRARPPSVPPTLPSPPSPPTSPPTMPSPPPPPPLPLLPPPPPLPPLPPLVPGWLSVTSEGELRAELARADGN
eukprot:6003743-Prymnesium_polylepis.1